MRAPSIAIRYRRRRGHARAASLTSSAARVAWLAVHRSQKPNMCALASPRSSPDRASRSSIGGRFASITAAASPGFAYTSHSSRVSDAVTNSRSACSASTAARRRGQIAGLDQLLGELDGDRQPQGPPAAPTTARDPGSSSPRRVSLRSPALRPAPYRCSAARRASAPDRRPGGARVVAHRLLEMPAGDLVDLEEVDRRVLEPVGVTLVEIGAGRLREPARRRRRGSADGGSERRRLPQRSPGAGRIRSLRTSAASRSSSPTRAALGERATAERWNTSPSIAPRSSSPAPRRGVARAARRAAPGSWAGRRRSRRPRAPAPPSPRRNSGLPSLAVDHPLPRLRLEPVAELLEELLAFRFAERLEQHRGRVQLAAAPPGAFLEELRPCGAQQQDRRARARGRRCGRAGRAASARPTAGHRRGGPPGGAPRATPGSRRTSQNSSSGRRRAAAREALDDRLRCASPSGPSASISGQKVMPSP